MILKYEEAHNIINLLFDKVAITINEKVQQQKIQNYSARYTLTTIDLFFIMSISRGEKYQSSLNIDQEPVSPGLDSMLPLHVEIQHLRSRQTNKISSVSNFKRLQHQKTIYTQSTEPDQKIYHYKTLKEIDDNQIQNLIELPDPPSKTEPDSSEIEIYREDYIKKMNELKILQAEQSLRQIEEKKQFEEQRKLYLNGKPFTFDYNGILIKRDNPVFPKASNVFNFQIDHSATDFQKKQVIYYDQKRTQNDNHRSSKVDSHNEDKQLSKNPSLDHEVGKDGTIKIVNRKIDQKNLKYEIGNHRDSTALYNNNGFRQTSFIKDIQVKECVLYKELQDGRVQTVASDHNLPLTIKNMKYSQFLDLVKNNEESLSTQQKTKRSNENDSKQLIQPDLPTQNNFNDTLKFPPILPQYKTQTFNGFGKEKKQYLYGFKRRVTNSVHQSFQDQKNVQSKPLKDRYNVEL